MSTNLKEQVRTILWRLLEEHYNVDKKLPQILTAKKIVLGPNPINEVADKFTDMIEQIVLAQVEALSITKDEEFTVVPQHKEDYTNREYPDHSDDEDDDLNDDAIWPYLGRD